MKHTFRLLLLPALTWFAIPGSVDASVIFKPGEKARYEAPGEEEVTGSAQQMFGKAQQQENSGNIKGAIKSYRVLVRRHPRDTLAPKALYRVAQLQEQIREYLKAAQSYATLTEKFPKSEDFNPSVEALFRIGEIYLNGRKVKLLGIPFKASMDEAVKIFEAIIRVAPYGKYAARAHFDVGRAREKQGSNELAIAAYQQVVEKFPEDPLAADAQYQIGYIWTKAAQSGTYDPAAAAKAKIGFQDFLYRHPHSEKSAQAQENLKKIDHKQTSTAFEIARFYDKQRLYKAAAIYYNDVIRQQPESAEGDKAKKRISELRAKLGEGVLQSPALTAATANRKSKKMEMPPGPGGGTNPGPDSRQDLAPLPSADIDLSLPPPASLQPDTTTAPATTTTEPPTTATDVAPAPETSPEATAAPEP